MNEAALPLKLNNDHWTVTAITLTAFTDDIDTPVRKTELNLHRGQLGEKLEGNIFFLENEHDGNAYVIITDCPDNEKAVLTVNDFTVDLNCGTNPVAIVPCKKGECYEACRTEYKKRMPNRPLISMSNTWGDRNGFSRVCEAFVMREIDKAAVLGLDVVQIDDGWQVGNTADPSILDSKNRRTFDDYFWQLNTERFPNGIRFLSDYAAKKAVKLGLWFAPDSRDHFARAKRDIAILKNAYDNWGARFFKLDMYWIECDEDRDAFLSLLKAVYDFGDDVFVQIDVTTPARINYLCGREYGTIFVENRYTKWRTYYPNRTLKNLWLLSSCIPASKLQFELVNSGLNADCYDENDDFAPSKYDIDYLFASVMLSNPLFWMELQFLSDDNTEKLKKIIGFWHSYRDIFRNSDVSPIGEKPSGRSFTGFRIKNGNDQYALLFREATFNDSGVYLMPRNINSAEVLLSNAEVTVESMSNALKATFSKPRSYAFIKLN